MLQELTQVLLSLIWSDEAGHLFGGSWFYSGLAGMLLYVTIHTAPVRTVARKCTKFCVGRCVRVIQALKALRPKLLVSGRWLVASMHILYF